MGTHNQLQSDGISNFTYDHEGNLITQTNIATGQVREFVWDYRNRLVNVIDRSGTNLITQNVHYTYDAFDRKVGKQLDADGDGIFDVYAAYVYDGQHTVLEFKDSDGAGTAQDFKLKDRLLYGDIVDMLFADEQFVDSLVNTPTLAATIASSTTGETLWTLSDNLGSIRDAVDNNGIVRQHNDYDSFGNRTTEIYRDASGNLTSSIVPGTIQILFGFTGRDLDPNTGLQYNRHRWYDAKLARWISQDPIGFTAFDTNLYRYVRNQAVGRNDPDGLQEAATVQNVDDQPYPDIHTSGEYGGTPVAPIGDGEAISIGGEHDNPLYKDYSTNEDNGFHRKGSIFPKDPPRPITEDLKDGTVSDICIRSTPISPYMWREIIRISDKKASITISGPKEFIIPLYSDVQGLKVLSTYRVITIPKKVSIPGRLTGGQIVTYGGGYSFTVVLRESCEYVPDKNEKNTK